MKLFNKILPYIIFLFNLFFGYSTWEVFKYQGGAEGIGYIILPLFLICHAFIIPAIITVVKKLYNNKILFTLNLLGCVYILFLFIITI